MDKIKAILDEPLHDELWQMSSSSHQGAKWSTSRTHLCPLPLLCTTSVDTTDWPPPKKTFLPFTSIQQKIMIALSVWNESLNITKLQHKVTRTHTHVFVLYSIVYHCILTQCWHIIFYTVPATDWHRSQLLNPPTHTCRLTPTETHTHTEACMHAHRHKYLRPPSSPSLAHPFISRLTFTLEACGDSDRQRHVWTSGCCVIHS